MDHAILNSVITLLLLAVVTIAIVKRLNLPPILGYLLVGILFGEHTLGWIPAGHSVELLAELGVVFLLFMIGLEVSVPHLLAMRRVLLGLGGLQVTLSTLSTITLAMLAGMHWTSAVAVGGALSLSSTAIVVKQLQDQLEIHAPHGRNALGILLFQDLAVVPFLVAIPILAGGGDSMGNAMLLALAKAVLAFLLMFGIGRWLLRPVLGWITARYSIELFTLTILLLALAAAWLTQQMGLSLALGAFLAGVMLAETEYRHQIETEIRPFRDVLLGLFFITVGAQLNPGAFLETGHLALLLTLGVVIGKGGLIVVLTWLAQRDRLISLRTGIVLGQGGEFGFALLALALTHGLVDTVQVQPLLTAIVLSMAIAPLLIRYNHVLAQKLLGDSNQGDAQQKMMLDHAKSHHQHVIIAGFGRVGQNLAHFVRQEGMDYLALDIDAKLIRDAFDAGEPVHYGDASHPQILNVAGIKNAAALVITFHDENLAERILQVARRLNKDLPIIVRTRNDHRMELLKRLGASTVVPESLESSLIIASRTLELLGVDADEIDTLITRSRERRYADLRGVFQGDDIEMEQPIDQTSLHTIVLEEQANCLGQSIQSLRLEQLNVSVEALKRDDVRGEHPEPDTILQAGDALILRGDHEHLARAEWRLLKG